MDQVNQNKGTGKGNGKGRKKAFSLPNQSALTLADVIRKADVYHKTAGNVRQKYSGVQGTVRDGAFSVTAGGHMSLLTLQGTPLRRGVEGPIGDIQKRSEAYLEALRPEVGGVAAHANAQNAVDEDAVLANLMSDLGLDSDSDSNLEE